MRCYCHQVFVPTTCMQAYNRYCSKCGQLQNTTCGFCRGTGYVEEFSMEIEYCIYCQGRIDASKTCTVCDGTGQIPHICSGF